MGTLTDAEIDKLRWDIWPKENADSLDKETWRAHLEQRIASHLKAMRSAEHQPTHWEAIHLAEAMNATARGVYWVAAHSLLATFAKNISARPWGTGGPPRKLTLDGLEDMFENLKKCEIPDRPYFM